MGLHRHHQQPVSPKVVLHLLLRHEESAQRRDAAISQGGGNHRAHGRRVLPGGQGAEDPRGLLQEAQLAVDLVRQSSSGCLCLGRRGHPAAAERVRCPRELREPGRCSGCDYCGAQLGQAQGRVGGRLQRAHLGAHGELAHGRVFAASGEGQEDRVGRPRLRVYPGKRGDELRPWAIRSKLSKREAARDGTLRCLRAGAERLRQRGVSSLPH
mmetsp:Transcript_36654/g.87569  ORF Transcript_36654/g.87569 Transcript_36654/m.87569 type:complete len:212 (+) Transcript_36654:860-1495(+)